MKKTTLFTLLAASAMGLTAGEPKDDLKASFESLNQKPNYSWTSKTELEGVPFTPPSIEGKTEKGGYTLVTAKNDEISAQALSKGDKAVAKTEEGWKTQEQMNAAQGGGGFNPASMVPRSAIGAKPPGQEFGALMGKIKTAKAEGEVITAELTDEGAKELAMFGRRGGRGGGPAPEPKDAKASAKVWSKDGLPAKIEMRVSSKVRFGGPDAEEREMVRIITTEIKDVGSSKLQIPDEGKKALEGEKK